MTTQASEMGEEVAEVLERAADRLEQPGAWTQKAFARNVAGKPTGLSGFAGPAVCWCVLGATEAEAGDDAALSQEADGALRVYLDVADLANWNDAPERTQAEVVAKLREAAAIARAEGRP